MSLGNPAAMDSENFDLESARDAADALEQVFAARTHRRKYLGEVVIVPGRLGEAVKLPAIKTKLNSRVAKRQESGLDDFKFLWDTLSAVTQDAVLKIMGWYEPADLDWDDKRSNRKPSITK